MQRRLLVAGAIALVVLAVAIVAGCGGKKTGDSTVVARVNGTDITRGDVLTMLERQDRGEVLLDLITRQLVRQKAKERGLTVTDEELNRRLEANADYALAQSGKTLEQYLTENGEALDTVKEELRYNALLAKVAIPDSTKKAFFEQYKKELSSLPLNNESVIYRRLVVASKAEAEGLRKQLAGAKDVNAEFAKLAKEKSLDVMTRDRGGMAGWLVKGKALPEQKELEKLLFGIKPGTVSEPLAYKSPVMASAGQPGAAPEQWQLVTVVKHIPPHAMRLEDNEDQIEGAIMQGQAQDPLSMQANQAVQELLQSLRAQAKIEILSPRYKALDEMLKQQREAAARQPSLGSMPMAPSGGAAPAPQGGDTPAPAGPAPK